VAPGGQVLQPPQAAEAEEQENEQKNIFYFKKLKITEPNKRQMNK
jgi:hypothetical protein